MAKLQLNQQKITACQEELAKKQEIFARLKNIDSFSDDEIDKIHCPIGLDIGSETPEEIALSIMAEIIKEKRR